MKQKIQSTLQLIPLGVLVFDLNGAHVNFANLEMFNLLGVKDITNITTSLKTFFSTEAFHNN